MKKLNKGQQVVRRPGEIKIPIYQIDKLEEVYIFNIDKISRPK